MEHIAQDSHASTITAYVPEMAAMGNVEEGSIYEITVQAARRLIASERHAASLTFARDQIAMANDVVRHVGSSKQPKIIYPQQMLNAFVTPIKTTP